MFSDKSEKSMFRDENGYWRGIKGKRAFQIEIDK